MPVAPCRVCTLPVAHLTQIDLIMLSDPSTWKDTVMGGLEPPVGAVSPQWRVFGAVRMAQEYVEQHGLGLRRPSLEAHYRNHLPQVSPTQALIDAGEMPLRPDVLPAVEDYRSYFNDALRVGRGALNALEKQIARRLDEGKDVDVDLLLKVAALGARMAQSQATFILSKGARFRGEDDDDPAEAAEGFMGERPSDRFGSGRIRVIDGQKRFVVDEGPKDRMEYNERADELGAPRLPV